MQLSHTSAALSATFDESNLVSAAGLVPAIALAVRTGLGDLTDQRLSLPGYFGANAGLKVTALVAGMVAGADSIDDMAVLRHGGMSFLSVLTHPRPWVRSCEPSPSVTSANSTRSLPAGSNG
ncbi:hypothetical protein IWX78_003100 [Mycetocola sp. CAN_C7]